MEDTEPKRCISSPRRSQHGRHDLSRLRILGTVAALACEDTRWTPRFRTVPDSESAHGVFYHDTNEERRANASSACCGRGVVGCVLMAGIRASAIPVPDREGVPRGRPPHRGAAGAARCRGVGGLRLPTSTYTFKGISAAPNKARSRRSSTRNGKRRTPLVFFRVAVSAGPVSERRRARCWGTGWRPSVSS